MHGGNAALLAPFLVDTYSEVRSCTCQRGPSLCASWRLVSAHTSPQPQPASHLQAPPPPCQRHARPPAPAQQQAAAPTLQRGRGRGASQVADVKRCPAHVDVKADGEFCTCSAVLSHTPRLRVGTAGSSPPCGLTALHLPITSAPSKRPARRLVFRRSRHTLLRQHGARLSVRLCRWVEREGGGRRGGWLLYEALLHGQTAAAAASPAHTIGRQRTGLEHVVQCCPPGSSHLRLLELRPPAALRPPLLLGALSQPPLPPVLAAPREAALQLRRLQLLGAQPWRAGGAHLQRARRRRRVPPAAPAIPACLPARTALPPDHAAAPHTPAAPPLAPAQLPHVSPLHSCARPPPTPSGSPPPIQNCYALQRGTQLLALLVLAPLLLRWRLLRLWRR